MNQVHNQHVVAYKSSIRVMRDGELNKFRNPKGNIASPARTLAEYAAKDMMYEIIRGVSPATLIEMPALVKPW